MSTLLLIGGGNHAAAGNGVGLDLPGGGEGDFGHHRAYQLIDQHGEQGDVADDGPLGTKLGGR